MVKLTYTIAMGVLFLVPFVGSAIGNLGRIGAALARLMMAADITGNATLDIYTIVENPSMAPVTIVMALLGGLGNAVGAMEAREFRTLSLAKDKMSADDDDAMGPTFKENNPKVKNIMNQVCKNLKA